MGLGSLALTTGCSGLFADSSGPTGLLESAAFCDLTRIEQDLEREANINRKDDLYGTAFHQAARSGFDCRVAVFEVLLAGGVDPNLLDSRGDSPLVLAVAAPTESDAESVMAAQWLVEAGNDPCVQPVGPKGPDREEVESILELASLGSPRPLLVEYLSGLISDVCE